MNNYVIDNMKKSTTKILQKEWLVFRRDYFRIAFELILPLFTIIPIYAVLSSMPYTSIPSQPLWKYGHESSSKIHTEISSLFATRNYSDCTRNNKHILVSSTNITLVKEITAILNKSILKIIIDDQLSILRFDDDVAMLKYAKNPPYDSSLGYRNETCVALSLQEFVAPRYNYTVYVNNKNIRQLYS